jgi:LuxR family maltose regulon positive regulatory protein
VTVRTTDTTIVRTKLHRPALTPDVIDRRRLVDRIAAGIDRPLTLVAAPAGYGKTTVICQWLREDNVPSAWVSLDSEDSDIRDFIGYVIAALRTIKPGICPVFDEILNGGELPSPKDLAAQLSNSLEELDDRCVLVLDDYHSISDLAVHEWIDRLLRLHHRRLHLVLLSRMDPPLSLGRMRARGALTEIRAVELAFTEEEARTFLEMAGGSVSREDLAAILGAVEGWPVSLRLAVAALRTGSSPGTLSGASPGLGRVQEFLISEVLSHLNSDLREALVQVSILDRFCAPLAEAVLLPGLGMNGREFLRAVDQSGIPAVFLDEDQRWMRMHHLVLESLRRRLETVLNPEQAKVLHARAAAWFEEHGYVDDALHHADAAGSPRALADIVIAQRDSITQREGWIDLDRWLRRLPSDVVEQDAELLMLKAWSLDNRGRHREMAELLEAVDAILIEVGDSYPNARRIRGEWDVLRSLQLYSESKGVLAVQRAQSALRLLPESFLAERAYASIMLGVSLQMSGELVEAREMIYDLLDQSGVGGTYKGRLLITLGFIDFMAADIPSVARTGSALERLGEEEHLPESAEFGDYFLGIAAFEQNRLEEAESVLSRFDAFERANNAFGRRHGAPAYCLTLHALGRTDDARLLADRLTRHTLTTGHGAHISYCRALHAELALRDGRISEAVEWAQSFQSGRPQQAYGFFVPEVTQSRILAAAANPEMARRGSAMLGELADFFGSVHNSHHLLAVLPPLADVLVREGDASADTILRQALEERRFAEEILAAFAPSGPDANSGDSIQIAGAHPALIESLTDRELEVAQLMAKNLTNRDIGQELFISPGTVKRHAEKIYRKLGVGSRREATAELERLGML